MNLVEATLRDALRPPPPEAPWQWAERWCVFDNTSPRRGQPWSSESFPLIREVMETFADNTVRDIGIRCSAQSAKTQTILNCGIWAICNDPGPMMWVTAAADEAATFSETRFLPVAEKCQPCARIMPDARNRKRLEINFATMPLVFNGANSPSKLQSKPIRWLLMDEVRNWPAGALDTVLKRTRAFWNARRVMISTPDMAMDAVDRFFLMGDQRHYYVQCPHCQDWWWMSWGEPGSPGGMKWDENETTRPNGQWDFDALAPTIHFECFNRDCRAQFKDLPRVRRELLQGGHWRRHNPTAPHDRRSYHWNAIYPEWVPWRSLVEEYLLAQQALAQGDREPMKTFVNESLGQGWRDEMGAIQNWDFLEDRKADYQLASHLPPGVPWTWEPEVSRFGTIDMQGKGGRHFHCLARAWASNGASRLIEHFTAWSIDEVRQRFAALGIEPDNIAIDGRHWTSEAAQYVIESGYRWKLMMGDKKKFFVHEGIRTVWQWSYLDPAMGTPLQGKVQPVRFILFSSHGAKDKLASYMHGLPGFASWDIAAGIDNVYLGEVTAEERREKFNARGQLEGYEWHRLRKDNHRFDLEQMQLICAMANGLVITATAAKQPDLFTEAANGL
jgi:hypothetical protein